MKKVVFKVSVVLLIGMLFFQCTEDGYYSYSEPEVENRVKDASELAAAKCKAKRNGGTKMDSMDLSGVVPANIDGEITVDSFLNLVNWPNGGKNLCTGSCTTGDCLPTKIKSKTGSDLRFGTNSDGKIEDVEWKNEHVDPKNATLKIIAEKCKCK